MLAIFVAVIFYDTALLYFTCLATILSKKKFRGPYNLYNTENESRQYNREVAIFGIWLFFLIPEIRNKKIQLFSNLPLKIGKQLNSVKINIQLFSWTEFEYYGLQLRNHFWRSNRNFNNSRLKKVLYLKSQPLSNRKEKQHTFNSKIWIQIPKSGTDLKKFIKTRASTPGPFLFFRFQILTFWLFYFYFYFHVFTWLVSVCCVVSCLICSIVGVCVPVCVLCSVWGCCVGCLMNEEIWLSDVFVSSMESK